MPLVYNYDNNIIILSSFNKCACAENSRELKYWDARDNNYGGSSFLSLRNTKLYNFVHVHEEAGMGVLQAAHRDVVIVVDSSAALSGLFPTILKDYLQPCLE